MDEEYLAQRTDRLAECVLTPRELDVWRRSVRSQDSATIAESLGISQRWVREIRATAYIKLRKAALLQFSGDARWGVTIAIGSDVRWAADTTARTAVRTISRGMLDNTAVSP